MTGTRAYKPISVLDSDSNLASAPFVKSWWICSTLLMDVRCAFSKPCAPLIWKVLHFSGPDGASADYTRPWTPSEHKVSNVLVSLLMFRHIKPALLARWRRPGTWTQFHLTCVIQRTLTCRTHVVEHVSHTGSEIDEQLTPTLPTSFASICAHFSFLRDLFLSKRQGRLLWNTKGPAWKRWRL